MPSFGASDMRAVKRAKQELGRGGISLSPETQGLGLWVAKRCGPLSEGATLQWEPLMADGSDRRFFRVRRGRCTFVVLVNPVGTRKGTGENDAYWSIGRHLAERGVPVPALYHYHRRRGWIMLEDLGTVNLQTAVGAASSREGVMGLYEPVLDALLTLQIRAREGFQETWCYQGPKYDRRLMLERESGYFLQAFVKGYLGWRGDEAPLMDEFQRLAESASEARNDFVIHRDLQSRNILLPAPGRLGLIDFQGARWGPPQYDVASLVLDPYVDLTQETRRQILASYLERLRSSRAMDPEAFMDHYPVIALHRCLQVLGAFAFLGCAKRKTSFLRWIPRGLSQLRSLLGAYPELPCPALRGLLELLDPSPSQGTPAPPGCSPP